MKLGLIVGLEEGPSVIASVGVAVDLDEGSAEGDVVGLELGDAVGEVLGLELGDAVGDVLGLAEGASVGLDDGLAEGARVGFNVGDFVGGAVTLLAFVPEDVGGAEEDKYLFAELSDRLDATQDEPVSIQDAVKSNSNSDRPQVSPRDVM